MKLTGCDSDDDRQLHIAVSQDNLHKNTAKKKEWPPKLIATEGSIEKQSFETKNGENSKHTKVNKTLNSKQLKGIFDKIATKED